MQVEHGYHSPFFVFLISVDLNLLSKDGNVMRVPCERYVDATPPGTVDNASSSVLLDVEEVLGRGFLKQLDRVNMWVSSVKHGSQVQVPKACID